MMGQRRCARAILLAWMLGLWQVMPVLPNEEDLYAVLGVTRDASREEIKRAYRRKALESHPDKNVHVPPERAAEEFQNVVQAFEVLSDQNARRHYDETGRTATDGSDFGARRGHHFYFNEGRWTHANARRGPKSPLKHQSKVRDSMARVLEVASFFELKAIMLRDRQVNVTKEETVEEKKDEIIVANKSMVITQSVRVTTSTVIETTIDHETIGRHLLMVFTTAGAVETIVDDVIVFPYPFAGLSPQGIWWEDFLKTIKVRFRQFNKLTRFFDIPHSSKMDAPIFIFVKKGNTLDDYEKLVTARRDMFTSWMWSHLIVEDVQFINRHDRDVDLYWVHDDQIRLQSTLEPGHIATMNCRLSHTFWVRDSRVNQHLTDDQTRKLEKDELLSENSTIQVVNIVSSEKNQVFEIDIKGCMDLSTTCKAWRDDNNCTKEDDRSLFYSGKYCRKTCGVCTAEDDYHAKKERDRCKDHEGSCRIWARMGECAKNDQYMRMRCPYSCKFCDPKEESKLANKFEEGYDVDIVGEDYSNSEDGSSQPESDEVLDYDSDEDGLPTGESDDEALLNSDSNQDAQWADTEQEEYDSLYGIRDDGRDDQGYNEL